MVNAISESSKSNKIQNQLFRFSKKSLLVITLMIAICFGNVTNSNAQTLVWQDNFDSTINGNAWTYDFGDGCDRSLCGWGNSELEYYTSRPDNVRIENGNLVIEAKKETFVNSAFTSGRIKTEGRMHFKYGILEARIKVPDNKNGLWPALWTLGTVGGVWPNIGEIDILEMGAQAAIQANVVNKRVSGATHWENSGAQGDTVSTYDNPIDLNNDYHIYKMVWNSTTITMYIDNVLYFNFNIGNYTVNSREEFHNPHFLLMNVAVGGIYPGIFAANGITAPLPGKMLVDYVKLYQNPGDELYVGADHAACGNVGVYTETTPISDSIQLGKDAVLNYWNNLTNITSPAPIPYEGSQVLAVHANAGNWFGMGLVNKYVNLSNYGSGYLHFAFKSSYAGQFKMGITTGHGQTWINFAAGVEKYGLLRDGKWHIVNIPMTDFNNPSQGMNIDLWSVKGAFMFAGDPAGANADFYFDDMYFFGCVLTNPKPTVSITSPSNNTVFIDPLSVNISVDASVLKDTIHQVALYNGNTWLGTDSIAPYTFTINNPAFGIDTLTAIATTLKGASTTSSPIVIFISPSGNTLPTVQITSPTNNSNFLTPASIFIAANANDSDGTITSVSFYHDSVLIGSSNNSPYSITWAGATAGNYTLTAIATDNNGATTTSNVINLLVANPIKPTIQITSPLNGSNFVPPATIVIKANAADSNGVISKVDFYNGTNLLSTVTTSPYNYTWSNVANGTYTLTAVATDNDGNTTTSSPVTITVKPVACTGIASNGDFQYEVYSSGGKVYYTFHPLAPILGSSGAIIYVKTGIGGGTYPGYTMTQVGTNFTYSASIATGTLTSFYFSYNVPSGGQRNSSADPQTYTAGTVCVAGAPTVSITAPADAASFIAPASITISANAASVGDSIVSVGFYSGTTLIGTSTQRPYSYNWTGVPVGSYALTAVATNSSNISTTSTVVRIVVNAPNTDGYCGFAFTNDYEYKAETKNGIVTFTFHPLGAIVGSAYSLIYIRVGSSGGYGGYNMTASGGDFIFTTPYTSGTVLSFYFTYQVPSGGEHNSSANPHNYTVGTNCTGITASTPNVVITSPIANQVFTEPATVTINATATDSTGTITKVLFYNGATLLGVDSVAPYSFTWPNVAAGNYVVTAKAFNNSGLFTVSSVVNVVVGIDNSMGYCGTLANGDYSYRFESKNGKVKFIFHPLTPIQGCGYVFIYVKEGLVGGYPGYAMTAVGNDFTFSKAIADSTPLSVYFTYQVPSGGERNSSATPHSSKAGAVCTSTLPITLISYTTSRLENGNIAINWTTSNEINNAFYLVEKSADGIHFNQLNKVVASSSNSNQHEYVVIDSKPFEGNNYYRLIQMDISGQAHYYEIKLVNVSSSNTSITVFPIPLKGSDCYIDFHKTSKTPRTIVVTNVAGKIILQGKYVQQGNIIRIHFDNKPTAGIYFLKTDDGTIQKLMVD